ncbi:unnamed protein product [Vitrella brassicaformis CCMP3155]|uniref:Uncharacterized protein n=1 Tax=Vitrella brassicaformis (strain CCMP3155) TaxID=1169540 RepID=A0A0G4EQU4_VITBC|nr:unnamed protein product [Vitrella brassicaformis CCMP3155]|eukprot:CEL99620.1 unnamed protein product [Vitrella brassicaformis CCMP3155]
MSRRIVSLGPDRSPHHVDDEESCDASHMSESTEQQHETKGELSIVEAVQAGAPRPPNSQKHRPLNTTEADCRQSFIARMGSRLGWTRASEATFEQTGPRQVMVCVPAGITLIVTQGDDGEWGWPVRDVRIRDECHHWDGRRSKRMKSTTFTKAGLREMRDKQMEFELWKLAQKQGVPYRERRRSARVATAVIRKSLSDSEEEEENIVMSDEHDTEYPPPRRRTTKGRGRSVSAHGHKRARAAARSPSSRSKFLLLIALAAISAVAMATATRGDCEEGYDCPADGRWVVCGPHGRDLRHGCRQHRWCCAVCARALSEGSGAAAFVQQQVQQAKTMMVAANKMSRAAHKMAASALDAIHTAEQQMKGFTKGQGGHTVAGSCSNSESNFWCMSHADGSQCGPYKFGAGATAIRVPCHWWNGICRLGGQG